MKTVCFIFLFSFSLCISSPSQATPTDKIEAPPLESLQTLPNIYDDQTAPPKETLVDIPARPLTLVNWNVWMGTNAKGYLSVGNLESLEGRERRYELQTTALKKTNADVIFLQELSPVFERARHLAQALNMDVITQGDNCGIRMGRWGIPTNLYMGMTLLAKKDLKLAQEFPESRGLSSGQLPGFLWGFCRPWGAFQVAERRVYLTGSIEWGGERVWVVNTHFHNPSGTCQPGTPTCKLLDEWTEQIRLTADQRQMIESAMNLAEEKRRLAALHLLSILPKDTPTLLAGDLNAPPQESSVQQIIQGGFEDLSHRIPATWVPSQNPSIIEQVIRAQEHLSRLTIVEEFEFEDTKFDKKIDYIFARHLPHLQVLEVGTTLDKAVDGIWLSDHFGIKVRIQK